MNTNRVLTGVAILLSAVLIGCSDSSRIEYTDAAQIENCGRIENSIEALESHLSGNPQLGYATFIKVITHNCVNEAKQLIDMGVDPNYTPHSYTLTDTSVDKKRYEITKLLKTNGGRSPREESRLAEEAQKLAEERRRLSEIEGQKKEKERLASLTAEQRNAELDRRNAGRCQKLPVGTEFWDLVKGGCKSRISNWMASGKQVPTSPFGEGCSSIIKAAEQSNGASAEFLVDYFDPDRKCGVPPNSIFREASSSFVRGKISKNAFDVIAGMPDYVDAILGGKSTLYALTNGGPSNKYNNTENIRHVLSVVIPMVDTPSEYLGVLGHRNQVTDSELLEMAVDEGLDFKKDKAVSDYVFKVINSGDGHMDKTTGSTREKYIGLLIRANAPVDFYKDTELTIWDTSKTGKSKRFRNISPLMAGLILDHEDVLKVLKSAGSRVDGTSSYISSLLLETIDSGELDKVRMLLDYGADPNANCESLVRAAGTGSIELFELLLDKNATPNAILATGNDVLGVRVANYIKDDQARRILERRGGTQFYGENEIALMRGIVLDDVAAVKSAIDEGASPQAHLFGNCHGNALVSSSSLGSKAVADYLSSEYKWPDYDIKRAALQSAQ